MQRYFSDSKDKTFYLSEDDSYHITKVMRMNLNDKIEVVIDKELYICEIKELNKNVLVEKIEKIDTDSELDVEVTIAQSLVKEQKMDLILQKCCEMGVKEIIPIKASRSIVKIDKDEKKKIDRWNKIFKEASEQSKRVEIPEVKEVLSIKELSKKEYDYKILCSVNEMSTTLNKVLSNIKEHDKILFVIGPEGGFTDEEEKILMENGFISTSLGKRVLRTETASLYVLSIINYIFMR